MQIGQTVKTAASYARRSGFDFHICNHIPFDGHVLLECVAFLILKSSDHTWFEDSFLPNYFFENQLMRNCHILSYVFCTFTVHSCYRLTSWFPFIFCILCYRYCRRPRGCTKEQQNKWIYINIGERRDLFGNMRNNRFGWCKPFSCGRYPFLL